MEIERIEIRHYIEVYWKGKEQTTVTQVVERDPLLFYNEANAGIMTGIRFFDRRNVVIDEAATDVVYGGPENYSQLIYFGKRWKKSNFKELGAFIFPISMETFLAEKGVTSLIICDNGEWILNPTGITIGEYRQLLQTNQDKIKCHKDIK